jgi:hypothetical protein
VGPIFSGEAEAARCTQDAIVTLLVGSSSIISEKATGTPPMPKPQSPRASSLARHRRQA